MNALWETRLGRTMWLRKVKIFIRRILGRRWLSNRVLMVKAVMYRCFSVIVTFLMTFAITGDTQISLGISALDVIGKTMLYFAFDVSWTNFIRKL